MGDPAPCFLVPSPFSPSFLGSYPVFVSVAELKQIPQ